MPKKYKHSYPTKPTSSAHPSLAPSTSSSSSSSRNDGSVRSATAGGVPPPESQNVNDMLTRLRGIHLSATPSAEPHRSVAPLSQPVLLFPPSQHQPENLPPRGPPLPGPAAPASWSSNSGSGGGGGGVNPAAVSSSSSSLTASQLEAAAAANSRRIDRLPGLNMPRKGSLVYRLLRRIAMHWADFVHTEGPALSYVPAHLKKDLLALLVIYGPGSVPPRELQLLCYDDAELPGASGTAGITHVHAAYATGGALDFGHTRSYKDLAMLLLGEGYLRDHKATPSATTGELGNGIPDSWEDDVESGSDAGGLGLSRPIGSPRFAMMTHLDLSQASFASWKYLVKYLTPHLKQLTHLSLAYWPTPSLTTHSRNMVITSSSGSLDSRTLNWHRDDRNEWSEAVTVFQKLGGDLPRLKWLDLEGCSLAGGWVDALRSTSSRHIDWIGTFRGLETLKIGQGKVSRNIRRYDSLQHFIQEWAAWVLLKWSRCPAVQRWLNGMHHHLSDPEADFESHWARKVPFIKDTEIQEVYFWLEHEGRALAVANYITALRSNAGVPQKLTVLCTDAPSWSDTLVRHPERGQDAREYGSAGFWMLTKILPPDCMNSMLGYLDGLAITKKLPAR